MGWMICDDNEAPISSFCPEIVALVNVYTDVKTLAIPHVKLQLNFGMGQLSDAFIVPLSKLEEINWLEKDIRCRFYPEVAPSKAKRYIADFVRADLSGIPIEKLYFINRVGAHNIDGEIVFCTGRGLIRPLAGQENRPAIELEHMAYSLDIDPNLSEREAVAEMLELISLTPNSGRIILAQMLLNIMSHVYENVWKTPCTCVFLYGKTGTQKTTIAAYLTQMYNRKNGIASPERLKASIAAAIAILKESRDCVAVLDDLFPSDSTQIRGQQEETLIEISRYIADGTFPARMRGKKVSQEPPRCGILFTGEYIIGSGSDAARLLPVESSPPDSTRLKAFQDKPLMVSTFYQFFIKWFIENYDNIKDLLKEWLAAYREMNLGVHDRLQETHYFLNTAYILLMQYCFDKDFISEQDAENLHCSFFSLLTNLVQAQNERVNRGKRSEPTEINYLAQIRTLYKGNHFIIADNSLLFNKKLHDGVLHNNCLWLRSQKLSEHFPNDSLINITDSLLAQGALRPSKNSRTNQISSLKGKRFYAIPLNKLS